MAKVWAPIKDGRYCDKARHRWIDIAGDMLRVNEREEIVLGDGVRLCRLVDPAGTTIPPEVAETIRHALKANRMVALDMTHWDYAHQHKVDRALAWLAELAATGGGDA